MKKLLLFLIVSLLVACEGVTTNKFTGNDSVLNTINSESVQTSTMESTDTLIDVANFVKYCNDNGIPSDLAYWDLSSWLDFETNQYVDKYLYMPDDNNVFTVIKGEQQYKVTHRVQY